MPGRKLSLSDYRFGFNGKERDNEINGEGNSLDYGARIYDSRLGRWLSVDPLAGKLPFASPFAYSLNNPILLIDADGRYPFTVHIRSYHPNVAFGSFGMGKGYAGDNRGFSLSTAKEVTARINQSFTFDVAKGTINNKSTWSNESRDFKGNKETANPEGEVSEMNKSGNMAKFNSSYSGSNPLVNGSYDIDIKANFTVIEDNSKYECKW